MRPAWATICASCSWKRALRTECLTPSFWRYSDSISDFSIETVPTSTGWPSSCFSLSSLGDRGELFRHRLVEDVVLIDPLDRHVGRDRDHVHLVDVEEFRRLGHRRAGHARQLRIHAEVILEGDRGERLVLGLDLDAFLRFDCLVKAVRPAPAVHHAAGELVDDDDLLVLDDIVDVLLEHDVRLERLVQVVNDLRIGDVVEVAALDQARVLEHALGFLGALLGEHDTLLFLVLLVVGRQERFHDAVDRDVKVGFVVGRAGDDQRRPGFVDQDRVHLVDDCEIERPLDHLVAAVFHVVAQVIEAQFVVRRIGDVAVVSVAALLVGEVGDDDPDGHAKEAIDLAHPAGVAGSEIVVDGDNVDALALECVEIHRKRRHQRLAFTGLHLGNLAAMERDRRRSSGRRNDAGPASGSLPRAPSRMLREANRRASRRSPAARGSARSARAIPHRSARNIGLEAVDCLDIFAEAADVAIVGRSEDAFCHCGEHVNSLRNPGVRIGRNLSPTLGKLRPAM